MYQRELAFAHELAERAAFIGTSLFRTPEIEVRHKADSTLVTRADIAIETMIREALAESFPADRVLAEEEGGSHDPTGRLWIVDPIDATANFARGVPIWGTLIALQVDGSLVLGMANAPVLGERYAAVRGEGATMNGEPIRVSDIGLVGEAHVLFSELKDLLDGPYAGATIGLARDCWRDRGFGDFWANMLVARGAAEVMLEPSLAIWDFAAPMVIVEEAGGRVTTFEGGDVRHGSSVLVTNGSLHDEILRRLAMPADRSG
jgi:histidinol-phosphatase